MITFLPIPRQPRPIPKLPITMKLSRLATALTVAVSGFLAGCNGGSGSASTPEENSASAASVKLIQGDAAALETYIKEGLRRTTGSAVLDPNELVTVGADDGVGADTPEAGDTSGDGARFSDTNTQVAGVDEADLVKYDGEYIYIAANQQVYTVWGSPQAFDTTSDASETPIPVEADGGIGDGAPPLMESSDPMPVEPDGGIGDGAGPIPDSSDQDRLVEADEPFAPTPYPEATSTIRILRTHQGTAPGTTEVNRIELGNAQFIEGLYLQQSGTQKQLAVVGSDQNFSWGSWFRYDYWGGTSVSVSLYDVNTPENAAVTWSTTIDGALIDSRRVGDMLYVVTRYVPNIPELEWYAVDETTLAANNRLIDDLPLENLLPTYRTTHRDSAPLVDASQCFVPDSENDEHFAPALVTVSAINLNQPDTLTSTCVAGYSSGIFSSMQALYVFNDQWNNDTAVHKFAYSDQKTEYRGSGTIPGTLGWRSPAFRLGEKDGALIAVSTEFPDAGVVDPVEPMFLEDVPVKDDQSTSETEVAPAYPVHRVTVLKEGSNLELTQVAQIPNAVDTTPIGKPNEDIYAVRYNGDRGYIVTYQKTDPLYVVDLTNPTQPKVTGELHVEGYSDYLHPVGDYLIGIGKSAQIADGTAWYQGVQLGLFDVKDITAPALINQTSIGTRGTETDVSFTHKAFSFLSLGEDQYRMAFPVQLHTGPQKHPSDWTEWKLTGLYLYDLSLNASAPSLQGAGVVTADVATNPGDYPNWVDVQRGILHEDSIYYVYGDRVLSANWHTPDEVEKQ